MHKSELNRRCQVDGVVPSYSVVDRSGPPHAPQFVVECEVGGTRWASGPQPTKREAEDDAAARALGRPPPADPELAWHQTVLVDGDNVHEFAPWLARNHPQAEVHVFVEPRAIARNHSGRVHRARTTLPDATDLRMILYAANAAANLEATDELVIVSRDRIFATFVGELGHPRVRLVTEMSQF